MLSFDGLPILTCRRVELSTIAKIKGAYAIGHDGKSSFCVVTGFADGRWND